MSLTLADQYYLKAADFYPFSLDQVIENLNYALSYSEFHSSANCLMGMIYMYELKDYERASDCFFRSLEGDINFPDTYKHYSLLRIWQGKFSRAQKIIDRGMNVKGMDQTALLRNQAIIQELLADFREAKRILKKAYVICIDKDQISEIKSDISRIKGKQKMIKSTKKSKIQM